MSIFRRRRRRANPLSTRRGRTNASLRRTRAAAANAEIRKAMSEGRKPNISLAQLAKMQGKSTNKVVGQATNRANRPTEKQKKIKRPAVDPRPSSPERQRRRQERRLNRANASVARRLANAKRLTNVAAKAKKGTKNITDVLTAAKTAAGRTKVPKNFKEVVSRQRGYKRLRSRPRA